ncbi:DMT family transporter [Rahnella sp. CG8]|uniref:DMT family transporter n=1 Tax=Rahnella sp. CG8 TaxID=2726078 RepID=UPI0020343CAF|nr:DMT family transporter [Rahnella sp. CG8]MCM2444985.1 DMT family transporter [Rahnella sp. CG8]
MNIFKKTSSAPKVQYPLTLVNMSKVTLGILLALTVYFFYTVGDSMVKFVGYRASVFEIGLFVSIFSLLPGILAKPQSETWGVAISLVNPCYSHLIGVLRAISATAGTYAFISIPLSEAYSIIFLTPVFITLLSVVALKEKVTSTRWLLMFISFASVVIVVRPGFQELDWGHLSALLGAICSSSATTLTRTVARTERRLALFLLPGLYTAGLNMIILIIVGFTWPDVRDLLLLLAGGLLNGFAYIMLITALTPSPASRIAPIQYSQMVWGLIFGALFFNEVPDTITFIGIGALIFAGVANVVADGAQACIASRWAEYRARRLGDPPPPNN